MTANELLQRGEEAFLGNEFEEAERHFGTFLADYGGNPQVAEQVKLVKPLLALVRVRLRMFEEARGLIEDALALDTTTAAQRETLRFWRGVAALEGGDYTSAQEAFGEFYAEAVHADWRRVEALLLFGTTDVLRGDFESAAAFFESQTANLRKRDPEAAGRAVVLRLHALMESGDDAAALGLLKEEYPRIGEVTQIVSFQTLAVGLGSRFLERGDYYEAIACLQRVWGKERLLRHQGERLEELKAKVEAAEARGGRPDLVYQYAGRISRLEREIETFGRTASFDASVRLRLATAFRGLGRFREAALVLEDVLERMDADEVVEQAALALVQCWMQVGRWPRAISAADRYEALFGGRKLGKSLDLVVYLRAECEQQQKRLDAASAGYARVVTEWPDSALAPKAFFMRGMVKLMADANAEAARLMREFRGLYGDHPLAEDSLYWEGMAHSFAKGHGRCFGLMGDYLDSHPDGKYAAAAEFRRAFCRHSEAYYGEAIVGFRRFLDGRGGAALADEAKLLLGDALGATGEIDAAISAYRCIDPRSKRFFEDGWFKIGKALRLTDRTEEMRAHFEAFVANYPESFRVAEAVYEIGKIDLKQGATERAAEVYWETLREIGNEAEAYAIEDILVALPKLYPGERGTVDLAREFDELRRWAEDEGKEVLVVRAHWGKARALQARSPELAAVSMLDAGSLLDGQVMNPRVTVDCADARRAAGKPLVAEALYREARKWHPRSPEKDRIYAGLGYLALEAGKRVEAAEWFEKAELATFRPALKGEVMLARAGLYAEGVPHRAREVLEALLGERTTTSESKARALLLYASVLEREGAKRKALAYYERVYVAYGKFSEQVAEAYLRRGKVLEELSMGERALEVYRELLGREDLADREQVVSARERVRALGGEVL